MFWLFASITVPIAPRWPVSVLLFRYVPQHNPFDPVEYIYFIILAKLSYNWLFIEIVDAKIECGFMILVMVKALICMHACLLKSVLLV